MIILLFNLYRETISENSNIKKKASERVQKKQNLKSEKSKNVKNLELLKRLSGFEKETSNQTN